MWNNKRAFWLGEGFGPKARAWRIGFIASALAFMGLLIVRINLPP